MNFTFHLSIADGLRFGRWLGEFLGIMAKSSADDDELRRACEAAIEGTKQNIVMSIRVVKSHGTWVKAGKIGRAQMAKPRVLAISSMRIIFAFFFLDCISYTVLEILKIRNSM